MHSKAWVDPCRVGSTADIESGRVLVGGGLAVGGVTRVLLAVLVGLFLLVARKVADGLGGFDRRGLDDDLILGVPTHRSPLARATRGLTDRSPFGDGNRGDRLREMRSNDRHVFGIDS